MFTDLIDKARTGRVAALETVETRRDCLAPQRDHTNVAVLYSSASLHNWSTRLRTVADQRLEFAEG